MRQEVDIEAGLVRRVFSFGEQIDQQRAERSGLQDAGDVIISRAVPAAPAAVRKQHDTPRFHWDDQRAFQGDPVRGHVDEAFDAL
jgi:hypothetical protein